MSGYKLDIINLTCLCSYKRSAIYAPTKNKQTNKQTETKAGSILKPMAEPVVAISIIVAYLCLQLQTCISQREIFAAVTLESSRRPPAVVLSQNRWPTDSQT